MDSILCAAFHPCDRVTAYPKCAAGGTGMYITQNCHNAKETTTNNQEDDI